MTHIDIEYKAFLSRLEQLFQNMLALSSRAQNHKSTSSNNQVLSTILENIDILKNASFTIYPPDQANMRLDYEMKGNPLRFHKIRMETHIIGKTNFELIPTTHDEQIKLLTTGKL